MPCCTMPVDFEREERGLSLSLPAIHSAGSSYLLRLALTTHHTYQSPLYGSRVPRVTGGMFVCPMETDVNFEDVNFEVAPEKVVPEV